jgi:hypothetical protein
MRCVGPGSGAGSCPGHGRRTKGQLVEGGVARLPSVGVRHYRARPRRLAAGPVVPVARYARPELALRRRAADLTCRYPHGRSWFTPGCAYAECGQHLGPVRGVRRGLARKARLRGCSWVRVCGAPLLGPVALQHARPGARSRRPQGTSPGAGVGESRARRCARTCTGSCDCSGRCCERRGRCGQASERGAPREWRLESYRKAHALSRSAACTPGAGERSGGLLAYRRYCVTAARPWTWGLRLASLANWLWNDWPNLCLAGVSSTLRQGP